MDEVGWRVLGAALDALFDGERAVGLRRLEAPLGLLVFAQRAPDYAVSLDGRVCVPTDGRTMRSTLETIVESDEEKEEKEKSTEEKDERGS